MPTSGTTLTIASGIDVHGDTGFVGSTTGGFVTNNGTIAADGGGTITVQGDTNFAAGTLTGGNWQASNSSILRLLGANITTNAANILLSGASSHVYSDTGTTNALASFTANAASGSFTIQNGANLRRANPSPTPVWSSSATAAPSRQHPAATRKPGALLP